MKHAAWTREHGGMVLWWKPLNNKPTPIARRMDVDAEKDWDAVG